MKYVMSYLLEKKLLRLVNLLRYLFFFFPRSSCIKVLESKIIPILAGVVAFCDTNENLSILDEINYPWKQDMWLSILNAPGAFNIQVCD